MTADSEAFTGFRGLDAIDDPNLHPPRWQYFALGAAGIVALLLVIAFWLVGSIVDERRSTTIDRLQERLEVELQGKSETFRAWLDGVSARGNRIVKSELVALFAAESRLADSDPELQRALAEQRPYMRTVLDELARAHELAGAYLILDSGRVLLQGSQAPMLRHDLQGSLDAALSMDGGRIVEARRIDDALLFDIYLPLVAEAGIAMDSTRPGAVLLMTVDASSFLDSWLELAGHWRADERLALQLPIGDERLQIGWRPEGLDLISAEPSLREGFSRLPVGAFRQVLIMPGLGWKLFHSVPSGPILAPIDEFAETANGLAGAIALSLALGLIALFWRQTATHHRRIADQYKTLARRIYQQAVFLENVMRSTADLIALRDSNGALLYANPAFEQAFETEETGDTPDRHLDTIFGALAEPAGGEPIPFDWAGVRRWLHVQRHELEHAEDEFSQLIVARDVTELMIRQENDERLREQIISALARAIELIDPYLEGHTARVETLCRRLAIKMDLAIEDEKALSRAAALCQIGKIFIPKAILTKRSRHSEAEESIMRTHIDHACTVVGSIDFGAPVQRIISQMHERLDGSGYPAGESAASIGLLARILGICDVFCARTWPRSYRSAKSQDAVCKILEEQDERYDRFVVRALRELISTNQLEDFQPDPMTSNNSKTASTPAPSAQPNCTEGPANDG